jgi:hypothetical protein
LVPDSSEAITLAQLDSVPETDHLKRSDVKIFKGPESHENGKFAWIIDPAGNKAGTLGANEVGRKK